MSDEGLIPRAENMSINIGRNTPFSAKPLDDLILAYAEQQSTIQSQAERIAELEAFVECVIDANRDCSLDGLPANMNHSVEAWANRLLPTDPQESTEDQARRICKCCPDCNDYPCEGAINWDGVCEKNPCNCETQEGKADEQ